MMPRIVMSSTYADTAGILDGANAPRWAFVRAHLDAWLLHINRIGEAHRAAMGDSDFRRLAGILRENGISLHVETKSRFGDDPAGIDPRQVGRLDAAHDVSFLGRVRDEGLSVEALNLDGAHFDYAKLGLREEQVLDNLVAYFEGILREWPDVRLHLLVNLPNWGWKGAPAYRTDIPGSATYMGDAHAVYGRLLDFLPAAGIPIAGVVVDNPYDYAAGIRTLLERERTGADLAGTDWMGRILELERIVRGRGMEYAVIFNSQRGGETAGDLYARDTVAFIERYYAAGGRPDACILESWYRHPAEWLPESDPATMAGSVRMAIEAILRCAGR